jgi:hypothetical protein
VADRRLFPPQVRAEVIRLACERPADCEVPLARWSSIELAREAVARGICEQISGITVWRWLSEDAIKPWQYRSWIFPRDPDFTAKAGRILDLYAGRWEGELLHPDRPLPTTRPLRRAQRVAINHRDPQPAQAPQPPNSRRRALRGPQGRRLPPPAVSAPSPIRSCTHFRAPLIDDSTLYPTATMESSSKEARNRVRSAWPRCGRTIVGGYRENGASGDRSPTDQRWPNGSVKPPCR